MNCLNCIHIKQNKGDWYSCENHRCHKFSEYEEKENIKEEEQIKDENNREAV